MKNFPDWSFENNSWQEISLNELGSFYGGLHGKNKEHFGHGDAEFITYMNVYKNDFADMNQTGRVEISANEKQNLVQFGDILFTQSSETVKEVATPSVWLHDKKVYLNSFCMGFRLHDFKTLLPQFAVFLMSSPEARKKIVLEGQGITRFNISASRLGSIKFKIPPLAEQKKIADYFMSLNDSIEAQEKKLLSWRELKRGLLQKIFSQEFRFIDEQGNFYPDWQEKTLEDLLSEPLSNGVFCDPKKKGFGKKIINVKDLYNEFFIDENSLGLLNIDEKIFKSHQVLPGDLFFTRSSLVPRPGGVGHCNIYLGNSDDVTFDGHIMRVRLKKNLADGKFIMFQSMTYEIRFQIMIRAKSSVMTTLGQKDLATVKYKIPCVEEQRKIADYFTELDKIISAEKEILENMRLMKKGLLQKLFV